MFVCLKDKLKHLGQKQVYAQGMGNYCVISNSFSLFFDVDLKEANYTDPFLAMRDLRAYVQAHLDLDIEPIFCITKHGVQVLTPPIYSLQQVYRAFNVLKRNFKTSYFWSLPLWLRISEKFNKHGIISPRPTPYQYNTETSKFELAEEAYRNLIRVHTIRKIYITWD